MPQIGSQICYTRLASNLHASDWLPEGRPQIGCQVGCPRLAPRWVPQLGSQMGHPRLAPRWHAPDWPPIRAHKNVFHMGSSGLAPRWGSPRIASRWGTSDKLPEEAPQIGTKLRYPRLAPRVHWCPDGVPQIGFKIRHPRLASKYGSPEWLLDKAPQFGS